MVHVEQYLMFRDLEGLSFENMIRGLRHLKLTIQRRQIDFVKNT